MGEAESVPGGLQADQRTSGVSAGTGWVFGVMVGHGLTSDLALISVLLKQSDAEYLNLLMRSQPQKQGNFKKCLYGFKRKFKANDI